MFTHMHMFVSALGENRGLSSFQDKGFWTLMSVRRDRNRWNFKTELLLLKKVSGIQFVDTNTIKVTKVLIICFSLCKDAKLMEVLE